jgi:hypothetical protein
MRNYRAEIKEASKKSNAAFGYVGYKVIDLQNGDRVLGRISKHGDAPNVYEIKTPTGVKILDLSKYNHQIDTDLRIIELNEMYAN